MDAFLLGHGVQYSWHGKFQHRAYKFRNNFVKCDHVFNQCNQLCVMCLTLQRQSFEGCFPTGKHLPIPFTPVSFCSKLVEF